MFPHSQFLYTSTLFQCTVLHTSLISKPLDTGYFTDWHACLQLAIEVVHLQFIGCDLVIR